MYRDYTELTEDEKSELRWSMYYGCDEYEYLTDEEKSVVDAADWPEDIPESIMLSAFGGYSFVEEDFFCNLSA